MRLLQGYYDDISKKYLDKAAEPVDISFNLNHPLFEYNIFKTLISEGVINPEIEPVGVVSWKFQTKTLITVGEFSAYCKKSFADGADVVFINPMIGAEAIYLNVWEQADHCGHSGMMAIHDALFTEEEKKNIKFMHASLFALCNYFVGNGKFWALYMQFCENILKRIEALKEIDPGIYDKIHQSARYHRNTEIDFRPFILERLFSTFLAVTPGIARAPFPYTQALYEQKFGGELGKYLYLLSMIKNNGIQKANQSFMDKWEEERQKLLNATEELWHKDDPQPAIL